MSQDKHRAFFKKNKVIKNVNLENYLEKLIRLKIKEENLSK